MSIVNENGDLDFRSDATKKIEAQLEKSINEIEKKYADYFASKKSKYPDETHDKIRNHIWAYTDNKTFYNMGIKDDSDLDESIKEEINSAFKDATGSQNN